MTRRFRMVCVILPLSVVCLLPALAEKSVPVISATSSEYTKLKLEPIDQTLLNAFGPPVGEAFLKEIEDEYGEVAKVPLVAEQIDLGRMLFYEPRLSKNQQISCNSCHQLDKYGVDLQPNSPGHKNQRGGRNSPTVYNAAGHFAQFWDGRAKDVEEQAKGPILNPIEMAMGSSAQVIATLQSMPPATSRRSRKLSPITSRRSPTTTWPPRSGRSNASW